MPAQALIRKLDKATIASAVTRLGAEDLLEVIDRPNDTFLVRCKALEGASAEGAPEALQAICDMDAAIVREEEAAAKKAAEAEAAAKKAAEAAKPSG